MKKVIKTCISVAACLLLGQPAVAAKNRNARSLVNAALSEQAVLIASFPAMAQVDGAIREDCASKAKQDVSGAFCRCAAAVTLGLWRSGADPKMVPRLNDYLHDPTDAAARALLRYQGPELYSPVCAEGSK